MNEKTQEVLTPEQAAEYLQVSRETIYRYIRDGKLTASKLGRTYRLTKRNIELFLWATRTRDDITLHEYVSEEIAAPIDEDQRKEQTKGIANGSNDAANKPHEKNRVEDNASAEGKEMSGAEFLLSTVGMFESEETDISENVEQYVAEAIMEKYS